MDGRRDEDVILGGIAVRAFGQRKVKSWGITSKDDVEVHGW